MSTGYWDNGGRHHPAATALSAETLVPFLLSVIASGERLTADEVAEIRRLDAARAQPDLCNIQPPPTRESPKG